MQVGVAHAGGCGTCRGCDTCRWGWHVQVGVAHARGVTHAGGVAHAGGDGLCSLTHLDEQNHLWLCFFSVAGRFMICLAFATKEALLSQTFCYIEQLYHMAYTQGAFPYAVSSCRDEPLFNQFTCVLRILHMT